MRLKWWFYACAVAIFALSGMAMADDEHGHGKQHGRGNDRDHERQYYSDHDRDEMRGWYREQDAHLPPGLRKKMAPCPRELEMRLPPPPPGCAHVVVGGHVVLVNRSTYMVLDIFHFER